MIPSKKDKLSTDEIPIKKIVLGEVSQQSLIIEEPSSPEDSRLLAKKRKMQIKNASDFTFKLNFC